MSLLKRQCALYLLVISLCTYNEFFTTLRHLTQIYKLEYKHSLFNTFIRTNLADLRLILHT